MHKEKILKIVKRLIKRLFNKGFLVLKIHKIKEIPVAVRELEIIKENEKDYLILYHFYPYNLINKVEYDPYYYKEKLIPYLKRFLIKEIVRKELKKENFKKEVKK